MTERRNFNLDAIRFFAALQVLAVHYLEHAIEPSSARETAAAVLSAIPGVPIFFFLSGYLIFRSADRSRGREYAWKRFLRLYPALWVCLAVSVAMVLMTGYKPAAASSEVGAWLLAQVTIGQSYNPEFLRQFGTGVLNGSLWTIGVEVQFYVIAPLLLSLIRRLHSWHPTSVLLLLVPAIIGNEVFAAAKVAGAGGLPVKVLSITILPFLMYFLLGGIAYVARLKERAASGTFLIASCATYVGAAAITAALGGRFGGNYLHAPLGLLLCAGVLALVAAPAAKWTRVFDGRDYSYSLYLYHMPIINAVLFMGWSAVVQGLVFVASVALLSVLSWHLIERPALRFARSTERSTQSVVVA